VLTRRAHTARFTQTAYAQLNASRRRSSILSRRRLVPTRSWLLPRCRSWKGREGRWPLGYLHCEVRGQLLPLGLGPASWSSSTCALGVPSPPRTCSTVHSAPIPRTRSSPTHAACRTRHNCPGSPLTQLCPLSSAPFPIVKGLYLGQVSSQVSAVVCLSPKTCWTERGDHTRSGT